MSPFGKYAKRSLLPFLGDTLSWLTRTAMTKDVRDIKSHPAYPNTDPTTGNIGTCHLYISRYATQVNRQHINGVMEVVERTHNVTTLFNNTSSVYSCINYQIYSLTFTPFLLISEIHSILANLRASLYYMRQITMHALDYIDTATTSILSLHVLPADL